MGARVALVVFALLSGGWSWSWHGGGAGRCEWGQWGQSPSHDGQACSFGQDADQELAHLVVDPFTADEEIDSGFGALLIHYGSPLADDDGNVYAMQKAGSYTSCGPDPAPGHPFPCHPETQLWTEKAYRWHHNHLVPHWTFISDWKPAPTTWEPMFQAALSKRFLYAPGAGGTIFKIEKVSGLVFARIRPFGHAIDPNIYISGGLTVDESGNVYYNAIKLNPTDPWTTDVQGAWLVKVTPGDHASKVDYRTLIPGSPAPADLCYQTFNQAVPRPARPWPPPPQADGSPTLPPQVPCLSQRPSVNITPAIGPDGTIFTVSRAHQLTAQNYSYLVALKPNLQLKWAASLRDRLADGCDVLAFCRPGSTPGVDPSTNFPPAGQANDISSSSPTALADGGVIYGALTSYNEGRGHTMMFDRHGNYVSAFDFGWDTTPAIYRHDHTFSIVIKDNHYGFGDFFITQLDADLNIEWQFLATNTETCERLPDGTVSCFDDGEHSTGFEWCVNAPAVDRDGTVYVTSEDGRMYAIEQGGIEKQSFFLSRTLGAAYTPFILDPRGRIYAMNDGELFVLGKSWH